MKDYKFRAFRNVIIRKLSRAENRELFFDKLSEIKTMSETELDFRFEAFLIDIVPSEHDKVYERKLYYNS